MDRECARRAAGGRESALPGWATTSANAIPLRPGPTRFSLRRFAAHMRAAASARGPRACPREGCDFGSRPACCKGLRLTARDPWAGGGWPGVASKCSWRLAVLLLDGSVQALSPVWAEPWCAASAASRPLPTPPAEGLRSGYCTRLEKDAVIESLRQQLATSEKTLARVRTERDESKRAYFRYKSIATQGTGQRQCADIESLGSREAENSPTPSRRVTYLDAPASPCDPF